ncbi:MAG TPA: chorismate mutase, partial [Erwinia persicina]|nr:chorismate mutase [Erwinia persicina]HBT30143.1 chorismate mutase [Erwinia persicina]
MNFTTIEEVRQRIDQIDSELVHIIAQRAECVKAAASFKKD